MEDGIRNQLNYQSDEAKPDTHFRSGRRSSDSFSARRFSSALPKLF